jgi:hypothetical protein
MIYEIQQTMTSKGADLSFLSQYPAEAEICFPPLLGLEVVRTASGEPATRMSGDIAIIELLVNTPDSPAAITDLKEVQKAVNIALGRKGTTEVSIDIELRRIIMSAPIEFEGHPSQQEAGSGDLQEFEDLPLAQRLLSAAATALNAANFELVQHKFNPLGLLIEGHTSKETSTSQHTSLMRADACAVHVREALQSINSSLSEANISKVVTTSGANASKPVLGLELGHADHRRVTLELVDMELSQDEAQQWTSEESLKSSRVEPIPPRRVEPAPRRTRVGSSP